MKNSKNYERLMNEIDNYEQTVGTIIALCHVLKYDFGGEARIGKSMNTSNKNVVSPNTKVTPDVVGQIKDYGLVSEVKKTLPRNEEYLDADVDQIKKYDDFLTGWFVNEIRGHDITVLIHLLRSHGFVEYLKSKVSKGELQLTRKLSVVEFVRSSERQEFFTLRKAYGEIHHMELDKKLTPGIGVPMQKIIPELSSVKFYDCEPPVPVTMAILWDNIFSDIPKAEEFRDSRRKGITITVELEKALNKCKEYFGPRDSDAEIPKMVWIKHAMEKFVEIGLAEQLQQKDTYSVYYRRIYGGRTLEYFAKEVVELEQGSKLNNF